MAKLYRIFIIISVTLLAVLAYMGYQSYKALTFMGDKQGWLWVESPLVKYDTTEMQSTRTADTKQLIYRQVDLKQQFTVSLNTTNNRYFMFTFIKSTLCSEESPYQATLTFNGQPSESIDFTCLSPSRAIFRIAKPKFDQLTLTNADFTFELEPNKWDFNSLKKDDYMQHNYQFFQKHSTEPVHSWTRD